MGFQMLKEMELHCGLSEQEQTDGELAEKAGRLAPASRYPRRGFISHPELSKHAPMFGAGLSIALYLVVSFTPVQRERTPLCQHGQEHKAALPSLLPVWA